MDNNAFVFSFLTKKIYNAKYNEEVIYDNSIYGPYFKDVICIYTNMLQSNSITCETKFSRFDGMTVDYELNNGDRRFYIQEIEIYQILYN